MEGIHGVDVSWLHHSNRDHHRSQGPASPALKAQAPPPPPPPSSASSSPAPGLAATPSDPPPVSAPQIQPPPQLPSTQPKVSEPPTPAASAQQAKTPPRRPALLGRSSAEKSNSSLLSPGSVDAKGVVRRTSWISNLSAKFSSSPGGSSPGSTSPVATPQQIPASPSTPTSAGGGSPGGPAPAYTDPYNAVGATTPNETLQKGPRNHAEELEPYVPQQPKTSNSSSFFSNAFRRLSSNSGATHQSKVIPNGGVLPRRVMNVDPNRERCLVPELNQSKLKRVAFCVDVEIAGGPKYVDEPEPDDKKKKNKEKKLKERNEGEALKHPESMAEEKEKVGSVNGEPVGTVEKQNPDGSTTKEDKEEKKDEKDEQKDDNDEEKKGSKGPTKKKQKKKRSEEERKERKERKRRKAEESGSVPVEFTRDSDGSSSLATGSGTYTPRRQDRPTTDPLRIYRRCCQLRETPILKRICDQLGTSANTSSASPGVVQSMDLTGSRMQLADIVTLGDWLAVVPVKKLILEDSDLTDEGVRVILAGLLAARAPDSLETPARRIRAPNGDVIKIEERTGVIEKITLKNNPKVGREGWLHVSLFIYMCRSLKAVDVSMIPFPLARTITHDSGSASPPPAKPGPSDVADILSKSMSERLGGAGLEELVMNECCLTTNAIRKVVDGVTVCGLKRLGLAGNNLDDAGLEHVIRYLRSGMCQGLDLGGNDLRNSLGRLAEGINDKCILFALSVADCNLTPDSVRPLFPALVKLPDFRFIDLSHNWELFSTKPSALSILRKYIPQLRLLKRLHLVDVSMSPSQAIGLAEVLPENPSIAHLNLLENSQLSALAHSTDEASLEEACALYTSLMTAVRVSKTIICIDIDVPGPETGEVVRALAKQVVAYCLRNMEQATAAVAANPGAATAVTAATDSLGEQKNTKYPDVLMQLVGHVDGVPENHDDDVPAPDEDYIVGGTGVVKALSYCLLESASDHKRISLPASGTATPLSQHTDATPQSSSKVMSRNLLDSARKIRQRLQPALAREASRGDDMAYRRLLFLDKTLRGIIQRFEDEYPECRPASTLQEPASAASSPANSISETSAYGAQPRANIMDSQNEGSTPQDDSAESGDEQPRPLRSHGSDVSLASRALSNEEGRVHRLGQQVRRDILHHLPSPSPSPEPRSAEQEPTVAGKTNTTNGTVVAEDDKHDSSPAEPPYLTKMRAKLDTLMSKEGIYAVQREGWEEALRKIGATAEELAQLETEHPEEFQKFRNAQLAAEHNAGLGKREGNEA